MVEFVAELRKHVLLGCVDCDSFTKSGKKIGFILMYCSGQTSNCLLRNGIYNFRHKCVGDMGMMDRLLVKMMICIVVHKNNHHYSTTLLSKGPFQGGAHFHNSVFKLHQTSFPLIFPVQWQSIRLIRKRCSLLVQVVFLSPFHIRFLTCTDWGCWSRQVENHRWPLPVEHCCYMLFIPLHRTKSTLNSSVVGPLKRKKPAFICRQKFT